MVPWKFHLSDGHENDDFNPTTAGNLICKYIINQNSLESLNCCLQPYYFSFSWCKWRKVKKQYGYPGYSMGFVYLWM